MKLDSQGDEGRLEAGNRDQPLRGVDLPPPLCVWWKEMWAGGGGVARSCPPAGRGVNDPGVHLSSPRVEAGAGREGPAPGSPGVREDREASSGHRGKEDREGRGGPGGHFLPGSAQFCKGSAARAGGRGQEVGGRLLLGRGRPKAAEGRTREGGAQGNGTKRLSHPVSPASLTPQPASFFRDPAGRPTSATFKVLSLKLNLPSQ